jgi:hypothetical protein
VSKRSISLAPFPVELFAADRGYEIAPAVSPIPERIYADRGTQDVFDALNASAASIAMMLTESTLETEALREKLLALAGSA